jgi:hypothetical protein
VIHWRKLHNEELHNLYSSPSIITMINSRMRWAGHSARNGEKRNGYTILVAKPEEKRPLGRPRRRWLDNVTRDLTRDRMELYGLDPSGSGYGQVVGSCEHGNEHSGSIKCWEVLE